MPETKEKDIILENLNYIGLDLNNIPDFLTKNQDLEYKPTKVIEQIEFKVYKYVNVKDIQILLTTAVKESSIIEKYSQAVHISEYLNKEKNNNIFVEILEKLNQKEIKKIEKQQNYVKEKIPFKVECQTDKEWEIYYSELTGKYFMIVSIDNENYSTFFYLLKKQIERYKNKEDEFIYIPITHLDYSKRYLSKSEISDIEKYIWVFTQKWPKIYEVFDKENELSMHIVGTTNVYEEITSAYKIELKNKQEATEFYTLLQSLFVIKAELPHHYNFDTQINDKGELIFEFNNKVVNFKNLLKFLKEEYRKHSKELQKIFEEKEKLDIELDTLKEEELEKNKEYLFKEKQVSTYLECRKSAFGKIKYFFRSKNAKFKKSKEKSHRTSKIKEENDIEKSVSNAIIEEKENYLVEDLIKVCIELDRINLKIKNTKLDIKNLKEKIKIINEKIKNATLFIQTIEEHKKSIFEFWRFSNKDLPLSLNAGTEPKETIVKEEKTKDTFVYICSNDKINLMEVKTFYLNPINAINSIKEEKISLSKIKIAFPIEIEENQKTIEIDMNNYKIDLKKQKIFRTNYEEEIFSFKERILCVYEYELKQERKNNENIID